MSGLRPLTALLLAVGMMLYVGVSTLGADLSALSPDDRQSMELACVIAKGNGPASYHACLNSQLASLGNGHTPDLTRLSPDDRQSMELACVIAKGNGPASYHTCLRSQLASLGNGHTPDLTRLSPDDRQSMELACVIAKGNGPASYHACLSSQLASLGATAQLETSPATTQNPVPAKNSPALGFSPPSTVTPACSESGSCYGDISSITGLPKTSYVGGYYRSDGTYVRSYYRSH